ncbi:MAG: NADP-specific glutamate dehydrogenase GdhA, partial [Planctomycetes bacterium]|nr:NADP-specific glutamate dehydrogenase GdhA [Planctomycetota bacterium]
DVARGGVRLIRVTPGNYETEVDNMPLLNYALGPVAQRLKHKDIAESGAKGVIVPGVEYARDGLYAMLDFTEGIMDLIQPCDAVKDYLGQPEMIFFGPDEGTAGFMDAIALRGKERGYKHWRTLTTGKSIGIPHDTYGLTQDRRVFGLIPQGEKGTELQLDGARLMVTTDMEKIHARLGDQIDTSGMTTMGVMACLRVMLEHVGLKESEVNLMMTGGPDGDLGANQIQSFKGRICLIVDGGSVLFDPDGLDRKELMKLAFARHTSPRLNSLAYPEGKLSRRGFRVPRAAGQFKLPDGTAIADGAFFHRNFLVNPAVRRCIAEAHIRAFVPCGGFKDTINAENIGTFTANFKELKVIVEGANVFFDDTAREVIARETPILQLRDSSANKGGVTSSSIAEVLAAFLLGDGYEAALVNNPKTKTRLIREVFDLIAQNATAETRMLLALHQTTQTPLYKLSVQTSEQLFALQARLYERLDLLLKRRDLVSAVLEAYIPSVLLDRLGMPKVLRILNAPDLGSYRDAILTKRLSALALYRHAAEWDAFLSRLQADFLATVREVIPRSVRSSAFGRHVPVRSPAFRRRIRHRS